MSASLVGSEMCIRDSVRRPEFPAADVRCPEFPAADVRRPEFRPQTSATPVSYTHLTLPTICSV
eukprot:4118102-Alexandrium_andersonii.AAC.1